MKVQDDHVTFSVLKVTKFLDPIEEWSVMEKLESLVSMEWENNFEENPLENTLGSEPLKDEEGNDNMALMEANPRNYVQLARFEPMEL